MGDEKELLSGDVYRPAGGWGPALGGSALGLLAVAVATTVVDETGETGHLSTVCYALAVIGAVLAVWMSRIKRRRLVLYQRPEGYVLVIESEPAVQVERPFEMIHGVALLHTVRVAFVRRKTGMTLVISVYKDGDPVVLLSETCGMDYGHGLGWPQGVPERALTPPEFRVAAPPLLEPLRRALIRQGSMNDAAVTEDNVEALAGMFRARDADTES